MGPYLVKNNVHNTYSRVKLIKVRTHGVSHPDIRNINRSIKEE